MRDEGERAVAALAGFALVVAAAVQGLFDAVLLLAPPMLVVLAGLGALLPSTRPIVVLEGSRRRWAALALAMVTGAAGVRSAGQLASIVAAGPGSPRSRLEAALRYDPGSYRLEILLALRAPCPGAAEHARRAAKLLPHHPVPPKLAARCR